MLVVKRILAIVILCLLQYYTIAQNTFSIIPEPKELVAQKGNFTVTNNVSIQYANANLKSLADYARSAVKEVSGIQLNTSNGKVKNKTISLAIDPSVPLNKEGYILRVSPSHIAIKANAEQGLFYGIQTLLQLFPADGTKQIPAVFITDEPRFTWRGMLFDNCRHMFSVDFIKKFIDQLAYHKLNKFHWHLTEDQGWRIEIKKYPRLQQIAAYRNGTQYGYNRKKDVDTIRYGGYYTQEQIKDIVQYAASRYVEVIPEIEMPGHSVAAITAYPYLACNDVSIETGKPFEVRKVWGVSKDILCAGNDSVFSFLQDVLTEVMQLFPSQYIHVGGDEAPHDAWKQCPKCQKRMQQLGLKSEAELQNWFVGRMEKFLNANGKKLIGWEEIMQGGVSKGATAHSWLGVQSGLNAAKAGQDAIMSPYSHLYFDGYQADPKIEPQAIGYWVPLDTVYAFEPVHPALTENEAKHILGAQANLWTEFIGSEEYFEYMVFPRISALSEIDWSPKDKRNYDDFKRRLQTQYRRYASKGIRFRIPTPELTAAYNADSSTAKISLHNPAGAGVIRYTTDGSDVTGQSPIYRRPLQWNNGATIRYAVFYTDSRKSSTDYYPKPKKKK